MEYRGYTLTIAECFDGEFSLYGAISKNGWFFGTVYGNDIDQIKQEAKEFVDDLLEGEDDY